MIKCFFMEGLVFKISKKEKVWTENNQKLFFEENIPSIAFSPFVLCLFSCLIFLGIPPLTRPPPYLQTRRCFSLWMER